MNRSFVAKAIGSLAIACLVVFWILVLRSAPLSVQAALFWTMLGLFIVAAIINPRR